MKRYFVKKIEYLLLFITMIIIFNKSISLASTIDAEGNLSKDGNPVIIIDSIYNSSENETRLSKQLDVIVKSITSEDNSSGTTLIYDVNTSEWGLVSSSNHTIPIDYIYYIDKTKMELGIEKSPTIYCFGNEGKMITGWMQDANGDWRFFSNKKNGTYGKMALGWNKVGQDGWYYFGPDGRLFRNMIMPDGKILGLDGKCINFK